MPVQDKILQILGAFSIERPSLTLSELSRVTGLPASTVHRIVAHLAAWGALERDERGRYVIGLRLWQVGHALAALVRAEGARRTVLEQLFLDTRRAGRAVGLPSRRRQWSIEQHLGWRDVDQFAGIGERLPLHASSPGLILLAFGSAEVRRSVSAGTLRRYTSRTVVDATALAADARAGAIDVDRHQRRRSGRVDQLDVGPGVRSSRKAVRSGDDRMDAGMPPIRPTCEDRLRSTANRISAAMREIAHEPLPHPVRRGLFGPSAPG